jgi:7-carboxy-7-deazaguanine synthase
MPSDVQSVVPDAGDHDAMTDAQALVTDRGYPVNEIFNTLQGEGFHSGTPATFLRLQGCPVGCPWCDTKHTWHLDPKKVVPLHDVGYKARDCEDFAYVNLMQLRSHFDAHQWLDHVVITGGEPLLYDLRPLIAELESNHHFVQVETSGTHALSISDNTWLTVSPKFGMPGGYLVREEVMARADELKYVVGKPEHVEQLLKAVEPVAKRHHIPIYLQPMSMSVRATELCIRAATEHGWRVSVQAHKYLNIR